MVTIADVDPTVQAVFPYLRNNTAFKRDGIEQAHQLHVSALCLATLLRDHFGMDEHAATLEQHAEALSEFRDHLDDHVSNLTTKAAIATSWTSDFLAFGLDASAGAA